MITFSLAEITFSMIKITFRLAGVGCLWSIKSPKTELMNLIKYPKLYIRHYVDDAVLVAKSAEDIHFLDVISVYCGQWELNVNVSTTKIIFFKKRYTRNPYI